MTVADTSDIDPCPYCDTTAGVQRITGTSTTARGWSCAACGTQWWISVVNPQPYLNRLTETMEFAAARSVLQQVLALTDQAPHLTDDQLRARLAKFAARLGSNR